MSDLDNSMSMNSLMQAIYGEHHTQYVLDTEDHLAQQIPAFMRSLINHLVQLCVTQGFADNVQKSLNPWIKEYMLHQKNPKETIQAFLKEYLRLFEQETQKINKYGQKKLKYLTQTVSKQIFTEIMRMACDLKLQSVNRTNHLRSAHRRTNNITIFNYAVNKLFLKQQTETFKIIKRNHFINIQKQQKFVQKLEGSIKNLDQIYGKKRRSKLWKAFSLWRKSNIQISQEQATIVYANIQDFFRCVLPQMIKAWEQNPTNWVIVIIEHISILVKNVMGVVEGVLIQFLANPSFHQMSSLDYSALSSYRSGISQMSGISIGEYLKTEEIKYDKDNKFVAIPIIAEQQIGLIKISWQYQLPVVLFNRTLKMVEQLKYIIEGFAKITTRLAYYNMQYESNSWHIDIYNLSLKQEALDMKTFQNVLSAAGVSFLEIYHDKQHSSSCIRYGQQNGISIPDNIYKIIWDKLDAMQSLNLDRELNQYQIIKLDNEKGFCRYAFEPFQSQSNDRRQLNAIVIQCIVPLLVKHFGKIGCPVCNIKIKQRVPNQLVSSQSQSKTELSQLNYRFMMQIKQALSIQEMQNSISTLLKENFQKTPIFVRLFYPISQPERLYAYRSHSQNKSIQTICIPKTLINQGVCNLQLKQADQEFVKFSLIMKTNPLFSDAQLYLYQNQKRKPLKMISKRIGRKAILVVTTYENISECHLKQSLNLVSCQIQKNSNIFIKQDIYVWSSQILNNKHSLLLPNKQTIDNLLISIHKLKFYDSMKNLCQNMSNPSHFFIWKITSNSVIDLMGNSDTSNTKSFPFQSLTAEAIQSHQNIVGVNRTLVNSKNYGSKISQFLSYIPNFSDEKLKLSFAEIIKNQIKGDGQSTNQNYQHIVNYLNEISDYDKSKDQFISIPLKFQKCTFVALMTYKKGLYISLQVFDAMINLFARVFRALAFQKREQMRERALIALQDRFNMFPFFMPTKQEQLKQAINKFFTNKQLRFLFNTKLLKAITRINYNTIYSQMKFSFGQIEKQATAIKNRYLESCQLLLQKITKIYAFNPMKGMLLKTKYKIMGSSMMANSLKQILQNDGFGKRICKSFFFNTIRSIKQVKCNNQKNQQQQGLQILSEKWNQLYRRNMIKLFQRNIECILILRRSLKVLQQEFSLMSPKSLKECLEFLTGRLNLMLSQYFMKPIEFKIISSNFQHTDPQNFIENQNIIFISNTSFALTTISSDISIYKQVLSKFVEPTLQKILPEWQIKVRKCQFFRLKITYHALQSYYTSNLKLIFTSYLSQTNKQNVQQCANMRKKAEGQKQVMAKLQKMYNASVNLQNRENHKKQIDEIRYETSIIQNQLHQSGVQSNIKSKTNAAYRMLNMLNKKKLSSLNQKQFDKQSLFPKEKQLCQVKTCIENDTYRYICQIMPIWLANFGKIINRIQRQRQRHFMNNLLNLFN